MEKYLLAIQKLFHCWIQRSPLRSRWWLFRQSGQPKTNEPNNINCAGASAAGEASLAFAQIASYVFNMGEADLPVNTVKYKAAYRSSSYPMNISHHKFQLNTRIS